MVYNFNIPHCQDAGIVDITIQRENAVQIRPPLAKKK